MSNKKEKINFLLFLPALLIFAFVGIFVVYIAFYQSKPVNFVKMPVNELPDFELKNLSAKKINTAQIKPKFAVLNFFASWCISCIEEHEYLKKLADKKVKIYGIAWRDDPEKLKTWLTKYGNPYTEILLDDQAKFSTKLGVGMIPETIIIVGGNTALKLSGPLNEDTAQKIIEIRDGLIK